MLDQEDLNCAIDAYEKTTTMAIAAARKLVLPQPTQIRFGTCCLDEQAAAAVMKQVPSPTKKERDAKVRGFLYVFAQDDTCRVSRTELEHAMSSARLEQAEDGYPGKKNLCAVNADAPAEGRVLYVGRSWDPQVRLKGHLRTSRSSTYALHLETWARELDLQVRLLVYEFREIADVTLQVIEDGLWDRMRPLFGKRGDR